MLCVWRILVLIAARLEWCKPLRASDLDLDFIRRAPFGCQVSSKSD